MTSPRPHWWPAYIGIGSNLEDPVSQVQAAYSALADIAGTRVEARSALYRSAPVGPQDQPDYVNAVAGILTQLGPHELLAELQRIETERGRVRGERWGARVLDLDLLVYGTVSIDSADLQVPHQRIAERNFVLLPFADIAPTVRVPGLATVARLAAAASLREPRIERLPDPVRAAVTTSNTDRRTEPAQ